MESLNLGVRNNYMNLPLYYDHKICELPLVFYTEMRYIGLAIEETRHGEGSNEHRDKPRSR